MKHAHRRLEPRVAKIREEVGQNARHDHTFVADRDRRKTRYIGFSISDSIFGSSSRKKQTSIEWTTRHTVRRINKQLFYLRQCSQRLLAAGRRVSRYDTPSSNLKPNFCYRCLDCFTCCCGKCRILAEEHRAGSKPDSKLHSLFFGNCPQEALRELDKQAAAVAGLAISSNGAAMRQAGKRGDRRFDDPVARHIVEIRDQSKTATVAFESRVIKTLCNSLGH